MRKVVQILAIVGFCAAVARAQLITDDEDAQSWNEIQLTAPLSKSFDFYTAVSMRFGKNVTRLTDGRFAIGVVWKPTTSFSVSPFYLTVRARNSRGGFRQESRLNLRATYRFPIKSFGLTHRSTYEYRMRAPENTWRYRGALTFEKALPKKFISDARLFIGDEVFYDSATGKFSRNRFNIGIGRTLNKNLAVDVSYIRQNDGYSHPGDLNIISVTWRVKL